MSSLLSGSSTLVPILSWSFLPSLLTRFLLLFLYNSSILSRPTDQRSAYIHTQSARAFVILSYLLYSFYHSILGAPQNYYQILGLPLDVDGEGVKRSFRALARKFHPDKVGPQGESYFILLRKAHDALQDAGKRFTYDRFGPDVTEWRECITLREYMLRGLKGCVGFYVANPIVYTVVTYLGGHNNGASHFWRLSTLFLLLAIELHLLVSPNMPSLLRILLPNSTPHDIVHVLHELFTISLLATQQLAPVISALELGPLPAQAGQEMQALVQMSAHIDQLANRTTFESAKGVAAELRPLRPVERSTTTTIHQAAASAAAVVASSRGNMPSPAKEKREPSHAETTWARLFTRSMIRSKLGELVPIDEVDKELAQQKAAAAAAAQDETTKEVEEGIRAEEREWTVEEGIRAEEREWTVEVE